METKQQTNMEYRYLGNTGLQVSLLGFGHMHAQNTPEFEDKFYLMMENCINSGVNYFDTAEAYGAGLMENILGRTLKRTQIKREDYVISTKFYWKGFDQSGPNKIGLSNKHILEASKASLNRLQLDNLDIIFCHRSDPFTSVEETCKAMNQLIQSNKTYYWGTSEWSAAEISEALAVCDRLGLIKPVVEQPQYNLFQRQRFEVEYGQIFDKYHYGSTVWGPLCQGLLTGKYNYGFPEESRWNLSKNSHYIIGPFLTETEKPKTVKKLEELQLIANELNCTLTQLAIAWIMNNPDVSTILMGASKPEQILENIQSLYVYQQQYNTKINQRIENILQNKPDTYLDFKKWNKFKL